MASFSVDITDIVYAGGRTGYKTVTISNAPSAGVTATLRGTNSTYFRVAAVETNRSYTISTKQANDTGSIRTASVRFTNNNSSSDYVDVSLQQYTVSDMVMYVSGATATGYGNYTVNVSNQMGSTEVILDVASGNGASGSVVLGSTWLGSVAGVPAVSDTGFVRFNATYITNTETERSGQIVYVAANAGWTNTLTVVQAGEAPAETLSVTPSRIDCDAAGGVTSIAVTYRGSTYNCDDTAVSGWASVSLSQVMSGVLSGTVTCASNSSTAQRSGDVIFSDSSGMITLPITQLGRAVTLSVSPSSLSYTSSGGQKTLAVGFDGTLTTNAVSMPSWLTQSYVTVDSSHRTYTINAAANNTSSSRSFDFELEDDNMGLTVPITQAAGGGSAPALNLLSTGSTKDARSGSIDIEILSSVNQNDVSYVISNNWITYSNRYTDGNGYVHLKFNYTANSSSSSRTGTITLSAPGYTSTVYTLVQNGTGSQAIQISPPVSNVSYNGGSVTITINVYSDVTYTISNGWVSYNSSSSNPGFGLYVFRYNRNYTSSSRTATITFSAPGYEDAVFVLNQTALDGDFIEFTPNVMEFNYLGGSGSDNRISIYSNGYSGTAYARLSGLSLPVNWSDLTITNGRNSTLEYYLTEEFINDSYTDLTGKLEYYTAATGGYKLGEIDIVVKGTPKRLTVFPDTLSFSDSQTLADREMPIYVSTADAVTIDAPSIARVTLLEEHSTYKVYKVRSRASELYDKGYIVFKTNNNSALVYVQAVSAFSPRPIKFPLSGGTKNLMFSESYEGVRYAPYIIYNPGWMTYVNDHYSSTENRIRHSLFKLSATPTTTDRSDIVTVKYWYDLTEYRIRDVQVIQEAGVLNTVPAQMSFSSNGGSDTAVVSFTGTLLIDETSLPSWLSITELSSGVNEKVYSISVLRNTGDERSYNLIFQDDNNMVSLSISQEVGAPAIVVSPSSNVVGETSGSVTISAFGPAGMNCNVSGNWMRLSSYSGSSYTFAYDANTSSSSRTATVTFSADGYLPATYRLTQAAGASLKANPTKLRFHKTASTKKISFSNVPSGLVDYSITYLDDSGWLSVSGTGLSKTVSVQDNMGSRRRAEIRFSDHNNSSNYVIVTVIQGGDGYDSIWMDTLYYPTNRDSDGNYYYRIVDANSNEEFFRGIAAKPQGWGGNVGGIDIPRLVEDHLYSDFIETNTLTAWEEMNGYCTAEIYNMTASDYPGVLEKTFKYWNDWSGYEEMYDYTVCLNAPINGRGCDDMIIPFCMYYDDAATLRIVSTSMNGSSQTYTMPTPAYPFVMTYGSFNYTKTVDFKQDDDILFSYEMNHCGPGAFVYRNRFGGWDSFLIEGNIIKTDNYTKQNFRKKGEYNSSYSINSLHHFDEKYTDSLNIDTTYEAHTGWLSDEESERLAFHLLSSPVVYFQNFNDDLYESDRFTLVPVRLTNSSTEYKKFRNGRQLVKYSITFEKADIQKVCR